MKYYNYFHYLLFVLILFSFSNCKKEEPLPKPDNNNYLNTNGIEGVEWILANGRIYRENLDNGQKDVFDHFGNNKTTSCMNIYGPAAVLIDSIKQNNTTWYIENGIFTLDNLYDFQYTSPDDFTYTPYGLAGGTSRPIQVIWATNDVMTINIHEAYGTDGTYNFYWINELTFIRSGTICNNCQSGYRYGYEYGGIWY